MRLRSLSVAILVFTVAIAPATAAPSPPTLAPLISAEDFGALPFMSRPKLSPDGTKVMSRTHVEKQSRIVVIDLLAGTKVTHSFAIPEANDLVWYRWAGDERILISVGSTTRWFGEDAYMTRLMVLELKTKSVKFVGKKSEGLDGDDVIFLAKDGSSLLLSVQKDIYSYPSVWNVDLATLEMKQVVRPFEEVWEWFADTSGVVRAGFGHTDRRWWVLYRKDANAKFEKVLKRKFSDAGGIERFIPIDGSDQGFAVANTRTGRYGLYRYDFATDTLGEAIFEHPTVDIDDFEQAPSGEIVAVTYIDDRHRVEWLTPRMKQIQSDIDKVLPNRINRVISSSHDGMSMLVWVGGASDPGAYYYYSLERGAMNLLARPYDKVQRDRLVSVETTSYAARDGLVIPAYLTTPRVAEVKALPLIVMPHGGPFVRDEWSYDVWAQFLANRGYMVLQPNFRGSTGYGREFVEKGEGQWGRGMQDDLDDGVKWLVDQGKVDPRRVCIMGASYGGYAAMWAAARNPDIYRCAISFAGISDLAAMMRYDRKQFSAPRYFRNWREKVQGDKSFDLDSVSPYYAADKVSIPLLIAHGSEDKNVPMSQSKRLHEALKKKNKDHSYVVYEGEGHGFDDPSNAVDFLKRVEQFLNEHNPAH
jgi:dipeptidyl aminopeptidase/acylaminoacyl peptidase